MSGLHNIWHGRRHTDIGWAPRGRGVRGLRRLLLFGGRSESGGEARRRRSRTLDFSTGASRMFLVVGLPASDALEVALARISWTSRDVPGRQEQDGSATTRWV